MPDRIVQSVERQMDMNRRVPRRATVGWRVLEMLSSQSWVCGQEFSDQVGWSFGSRLSELRAMGFMIDKRRCQHPDHSHKAHVWQYAIIAEMGDGRNVSG